MEKICPYLFVYGTLRPVSGHPMAQFLLTQGQHLGPARTRGQLYDLGPFPGMVAPISEGDWVLGDLFILTDPVATLQHLDHYEDNASQENRFGLYERSLEDVYPLAGPPLTAWLWWYRGNLGSAKRVISDYYYNLSKK